MGFNTQFTPYPERLVFKEAIPPTSVTAAGATDGAAVDINEFEGNIAIVVDAILATAGTTPTLTFTVEHRADSGDSWGAVPADALIDASLGTADTFDVVTAAANGGVQVKGLVRARCKAQIRVVATVGGTSTPSFKFSAILVVSNKYGDQ